MDKVINIVNLLGWSFLVIKVGFNVFIDPLEYLQTDISFDLKILRFMQLFQIFDIILILFGKSKGSMVGSFFQILGRNLITLIFTSQQSHKLIFASLLIIYAIADANRYLYYVFKQSPIAGLLRYNSFLLLYPIGLFCQLLTINDYISRNSHFTDIQIYLCRGMQLVYIVGIISIYKYMLNSRKKFMANLLNGQKGQQNKNGVEQKREKSPKRQIKRD